MSLFCLLTVSCVGECDVNQECSEYSRWIVECALSALFLLTVLTFSEMLFLFLIHVKM